MIEHGETWEDRGAKGWRRVVASPEPLEIVDAPAIQALVEAGFVVVANGGGGIPVVRDADDNLGGVEAVIDKDLGAALLARTVEVDVLVIATNFAAHNPVPVVLGLEPEDRYLARELPGGDYPIFAYIDRELPERCRVLFGGLGNPGFLCKRPYHADALFENRTLAEILRAGKEPEGVREGFRRQEFTHLLFRWDLVFDPSGTRSEIPLQDQKLLARGHFPPYAVAARACLGRRTKSRICATITSVIVTAKTRLPTALTRGLTSRCSRIRMRAAWSTLLASISFPGVSSWSTPT